MQSIVLLPGALAGALFVFAVPQDPPAGPPRQPVAQAPGHTVLVVEGSVLALTVTAAVAKPDAWGGVPKGLQSPFALRILDGKGAELAAVPLDLSPFDTDPRNVGKPRRVEGCIVRDPRIAMLVNVPNFATAASYRFEHDGKAIGEVRIAELPRAGGPR